MAKNFSYIVPENKETLQITLSDELESDLKRAEEDYDYAKSIINNELIHIWRWAYKAYHMSTHDRGRILKSWQSNVAFWLIRSFVDVFVSTLTERPINFSSTGYNDDSLTDKQYVDKSLAYCADRSNFNLESKVIMKEGLKTGQFAVRVGIHSQNPTIDYIEGTWDDARIVTITNENPGIPYAKAVSPFNVYPDPRGSSPEYITERDVVSQKSFIEMFWSLIDSQLNESPLTPLIPYLWDNNSSADTASYATIRNEIHAKINADFAKEDVFLMPGNQTTPNTSPLTKQDSRKGLIEYKYYNRDDRTVLIANGYPVYIGENPFGFIPYVIRSTEDVQYTLDCEGVPFKLAGMEKTINSFMNNYLDSVRSVASPTFIAVKGSFTDQNAIENAGPGSVLYADDSVGAWALRRLDKGSVSDFNILEIAIKIASQLTGISEYNLGVSSKERTATGAAAVTQSSQKRLSPFLTSFVSVVSDVGLAWVKMMLLFWTPEQFKAISGSTKSLQEIYWTQNVNITLVLDSMFSAINDIASKKLLELWTQVNGRGLINEAELTKEIFRTSGLDPSRFVLASAPEVSQWPTPPPMSTASELTPEQLMGNSLGQDISPQPNFWNEWQWQA